MRNFRMEKLAEFKKLAVRAVSESDATPTPAATPAAAGESDENVEFPPIEEGEDRGSYIYNAKGAGSTQNKESLGAYYDKMSSEGTSDPGVPEKQTVKPAVKPKAVLHTDVIDEQHRSKTLTDTSGYTYVTAADGKSLTFSINKSAPKTLNQYYSKWKKVVTNINGLPISTATTTATPAATTSPSPAAAATTSSGPTKAYDSKEIILGQVLQKMYDDKLVGTPGPDLTNEKRRVKIIMDGIGKGPETGRTYSGAAARVILNQKAGLGETIPNSYGEAIANVNFLASLQQAINGLYDSAFRWSRTQKDTNHVGFWRRLKGRTIDSNSATTIVSNYIKKGLNFSYDNPAVSAPTPPAVIPPTSATTPTAPAAPPTAPVAPPAASVTPAKAEAKADDGQVKNSSLDKKFIKAATLRRLKIRSQMEAAIDSSAQMGRARVY